MRECDQKLCRDDSKEKKRAYIEQRKFTTKRRQTIDKSRESNSQATRKQQTRDDCEASTARKCCGITTTLYFRVVSLPVVSLSSNCLRICSISVSTSSSSWWRISSSSLSCSIFSSSSCSFACHTINTFNLYIVHVDLLWH